MKSVGEWVAMENRLIEIHDSYPSDLIILTVW